VNIFLPGKVIRPEPPDHKPTGVAPVLPPGKTLVEEAEDLTKARHECKNAIIDELNKTIVGRFIVRLYGLNKG